MDKKISSGYKDEKGNTIYVGDVVEIVDIYEEHSDKSLVMKKRVGVVVVNDKKHKIEIDRESCYGGPYWILMDKREENDVGGLVGIKKWIPKKNNHFVCRRRLLNE